MPPTLHFTDDQHLRIGECDFFCDDALRSTPPGHLGLMKTREMVEGYTTLCTDPDPRAVVELGINKGGSTAMLAELLQPDRLVAIELDARPARALTEYIERRSLQEVVRPHYGVNQSDQARLRQIIDDELGDAPLDLVVDDASHVYDPTVASFEVLFPRLRPGGRYVIEDWRWQHHTRSGMRTMFQSGEPLPDEVAAAIKQRVEDTAAGRYVEPPPFTRLIFELLLARAGGDLVAEMTVTWSWVVVRRGAGELDPSTFRIADLYDDHFGQIGPPPGA